MPWFYKRVLHNLKDHKNEKRMSEEEKELEYLEDFISVRNVCLS